MKKIAVILFIFNSIQTFSQDTKYIDDFGNVILEMEFNKLKKSDAIVVRLNNNNFKKGIIKTEYRDYISNSIKQKIISFLESNASIEIDSNDTVIIEYAIDHKCNVVNNINFKSYIKTISEKENLKLFLVTNNYHEKIKSQIIDKNNFIKDNFFNYINWDLNDRYKCGGVLLINPDNSFLRIYGEHNPMDIFKIIK